MKKSRWILFFLFFIFIKIFKCLFIFEKDGERVSRGGAEREGDTESVAGSRL